MPTVPCRHCQKCLVADSGRAVLVSELQRFGGLASGSLLVASTKEGSVVATVLCCTGSDYNTAVGLINNTNSSLYTDLSSAVRTTLVGSTLQDASASFALPDPGFESNVTSYNIDVSNQLLCLSVSASTTNAGASVVVTAPDQLVTGANNIVVTVTAADGVTQQNYTLVVNRAASSLSRLSRLSPTYELNTSITAAPGTDLYVLSPSFDPNNLTYSTTVTAQADCVRLDLLAESIEASISVTAANATSVPHEVILALARQVRQHWLTPLQNSTCYDLSLGVNTLGVTVTAGDLSGTTYSLDVVKVAPLEVLLQDLGIQVPPSASQWPWVDRPLPDTGRRRELRMGPHTLRVHHHARRLQHHPGFDTLRQQHHQHVSQRRPGGHPLRRPACHGLRAQRTRGRERRAYRGR